MNHIDEIWTSRGLLHLTRDLAAVRMLDAAGTELQRFDPHSLGLQFPLAVGKEWRATSRRFDEGKDSGTFVGEYKVTGIETVTVPAGTFRTFRVEGQTSRSGRQRSGGASRTGTRPRCGRK